MTQTRLRVSDTFVETLSGAQSIVLPTAPWLLLHAFVSGVAYWLGGTMGTGALFLLANIGLNLLLIYTAGLVCVVGYRQLLSAASPVSLTRSAINHFLATLAAITAAAIVFFIVALFLSLFSVILIGISGYDPTTADPTDVDASIAALIESGAIWPLVALLVAAVAGLIWFALRLILYGAATVAQGRVIVFRSWQWTKGYALLMAPAALVYTIVLFAGLTVLSEWLVFILGLPSDLATAFNWGDPAQTTHGAAQHGLANFIHALILGPQFWAGCALAATLYNHLVPEDQATTPASSS